MATIYDIASAANTSPASVSRVLNGRGGVRDEAVLRIRKAMADLNFKPRWKAFDRNRFLVFIPDSGRVFDSGYVARIMSGVVDASFLSGFGLQLRPFSFQGLNAGELRQLYLQEAVSGCILISLYQAYSLPDSLDFAGIPHVIVGHKREDKAIHQVLLDDVEAGRNAAEFLISLGHRNIAMVTFSHLDRGHLDRHRGYLEAMGKVPEAQAVCIQCSDASFESGRSAARRLLSPIERPSAVVITNEDIAAGFQAEAREMGVVIPRDLSIVAFEETDKLSLLDVPLTAMQTPAYDMGVEAVKMLRSMITAPGGRSANESITQSLSVPLVARYSTSRPGNRA